MRFPDTFKSVVTAIAAGPATGAETTTARPGSGVRPARDRRGYVVPARTLANAGSGVVLAGMGSAAAALILIATSGRRAVDAARERYASLTTAAFSSSLYGVIVVYFLVG